jgi:hypothetical protein
MEAPPACTLEAALKNDGHKKICPPAIDSQSAHKAKDDTSKRTREHPRVVDFLKVYYRQACNSWSLKIICTGGKSDQQLPIHVPIIDNSKEYWVSVTK